MARRTRVQRRSTVDWMCTAGGTTISMDRYAISVSHSLHSLNRQLIVSYLEVLRLDWSLHGGFHCHCCACRNWVTLKHTLAVVCEESRYLGYGENCICDTDHRTQVLDQTANWSFARAFWSKQCNRDSRQKPSSREQ